MVGIDKRLQGAFVEVRKADRAGVFASVVCSPVVLFTIPVKIQGINLQSDVKLRQKITYVNLLFIYTEALTVLLYFTVPAYFNIVSSYGCSKRHARFCIVLIRVTGYGCMDSARHWLRSDRLTTDTLRRAEDFGFMPTFLEV